jgi:GNAT superfamily N-acetyltransferase
MSPPIYRIALARPEDLRAVPAIELAAARLLEAHAPPEVLAETSPLEALEEARAAGRVWVALAGEAPVGYALVRLLDDGRPHLEEMDVHPDHGRRGVGTRLLTAACSWARGAGHEELTLTTFRAPPWNMPFYAHHGFEEMIELPPVLRELVEHEAERGLDPRTRVVMRYRISRESPGR